MAWTRATRNPDKYAILEILGALVMSNLLLHEVLFPDCDMPADVLAHLGFLETSETEQS